MNSKQIKYINSEEIFTNVMDAVMPDRDKSDNPKEISNRLKMTNLVCGRLFSKFLNVSFDVIGTKNTGIAVGNHVLFQANNTKYRRINPAIRGKIILVDLDKGIKGNEEEIKKDFNLDDILYKEDIEESYKFKLYHGTIPEKKDEEEEYDIEDSIRTSMLFIQDNKLDEKYFDIMAVYLHGLLTYADKVLRDEDADYSEFKSPNKVRPDFVITPVLEDDNYYTKLLVFNKF